MSDVSKGFFKLRLSLLLPWTVLPASIFPLNSNKDILQLSARPTGCCQKTNGHILSNSSRLCFIHCTTHHIIKKNYFYSSFPQNSMKPKISIYIVSQKNYLGQDSFWLTSTRSQVTLVSLYTKQIENTGIENRPEQRSKSRPGGAPLSFGCITNLQWLFLRHSVNHSSVAILKSVWKHNFFKVFYLLHLTYNQS